MTEIRLRDNLGNGSAGAHTGSDRLRTWFVGVNSPGAFNAGKKAVDDVNTILQEAGFQSISMDRDQAALKRVLKAPVSMLRLAQAFSSADNMVLLQVPLPREVRHLVELLLRFRRAKAVILVHDIDSMRYPGRAHHTQREVALLGAADAVICHNISMGEWLRERGLRSPIVEMSFFDYLVSLEPTPNPDAAQGRDPGHWKREVVFAGNLSPAKSGFLYELPKDYPLTVRVFGAEPAQGIDLPAGIRYCGSFPPNRPALPAGLFGLVWDGPDSRSCTGTSGEYLKINSPHKASLYLACGLPVLCWRASAIARHIESQQLGIAVGSLHEVPGVLDNLPFSTYSDMLERVASFKLRLRSGRQLTDALARAMLEL